MSIISSFLQNYALSIFFLSVLGCLVSGFLPVVKYRVPVLAVCLFVALSSIYLKGGADEKAKRDLIDEKAKAELAILQKKQAELTANISALSARNRALTIENGKLKDVNKYISQADDDACTLSPGFVRLHNESAAGKLLP